MSRKDLSDRNGTVRASPRRGAACFRLHGHVSGGTWVLHRKASHATFCRVELTLNLAGPAAYLGVLNDASDSFGKYIHTQHILRG